MFIRMTDGIQKVTARRVTILSEMYDDPLFIYDGHNYCFGGRLTVDPHTPLHGPETI